MISGAWNGYGCAASNKCQALGGGRHSPTVTHHKIRGALSVWLLLKVVESANISLVFILLDAARTSG
jgi:hypothetical protein